MYVVLNVVEGIPGKMYIRDTWEEALDDVVALGVEQTHVSAEAIRKEADEDGDFMSSNGDVRIWILMPEN